MAYVNYWVAYVQCKFSTVSRKLFHLIEVGFKGKKKDTFSLYNFFLFVLRGNEPVVVVVIILNCVILRGRTSSLLSHYIVRARTGLQGGLSVGWWNSAQGSRAWNAWKCTDLCGRRICICNAEFLYKQGKYLGQENCTPHLILLQWLNQDMSGGRGMYHAYQKQETYTNIKGRDLVGGIGVKSWCQ